MSQFKCLILLNQPIHPALYTNAEYDAIVLVDGAANYFYSNPVIQPNVKSKNTFIIGDLDSISKSILKSTKNIVIRDSCQQTTDFQKAILFLIGLYGHLPSCLVLGALSGRMDHTFANLHTLFKYPQLVIMNEKSYVHVLQPGSHSLLIDKSKGPICGLVPLFGKCLVKTRGLEWEIDGPMEFGSGLVSTSNRLNIWDSEKEGFTISIECSSPIIWTIEHSICE
jgi:thiamine pyrophosphokinase